MKYYDKLIFEISREGRVGYSLPKNWRGLTPTLSQGEGTLIQYNKSTQIL